MARTQNTLWRVFVPLLIAGLLSGSAYHFMMARLANASGLKMDEKCPTPFTGRSPFQRRYLSGQAPALEQLLCMLVAFFDTIFQPEASPSSPFIYELLVSFGVPVAALFFEATRAKRPLILAFPFVVSTLCQIFGAGVVLPLYWGIFLAATSNEADGTLIDQASAEAVLFGVITGFVLPTFAMGYLPSVETIALWQPFPLWLTLSEQLHLLLRPRRSHPESGYRTVQATYIMLFIASTAVHVRALSAYNFDLQVILNAYLPTLAEPEKGAIALAASIHFLQWDTVFIFGSTLLATLWFAENAFEWIALVIWNVVSTAALGPGAAVAGVFLWRESRLNNRRETQAADSKSSKSS